MYTITCARSAKIRIEILCPMNNFYRAVRGVLFNFREVRLLRFFCRRSLDNMYTIICIRLDKTSIKNHRPEPGFYRAVRGMCLIFTDIAYIRLIM